MKPKKTYENKESVPKYEDQAYKKPYADKNEWAPKTEADKNNKPVRQLNPSLLTRPSKPYDNGIGYSKPQSKRYNNDDDKRRYKKYE